MNWFLNISTRGKLALGFGLLIAFLLAITITALVSIQSVGEDYAKVVALREMTSNLNGQRAGILMMISAADRLEREKHAADVRAASAENDAALRTLDPASRDVLFRARLRELKVAREAFQRTRDDQVVPLALDGKLEEAKALVLSVQQERFTTIRTLAEELAATAMTRASATMRRATWILCAVGAAAAVLGVVLTALMGQAIADPLKEITQAAGRIAAGDLGVALPSSNRRDEVGVLTAAFARMSQELKGMAGVATRMAAGDLTLDVRAQSDQDELGSAFSLMSRNLREVMQEILEAVGVVSSSTGEITASISQVAAGAAETAAAITETTTTVEEVKQTAQAASEKVRSVSDGAQLATHISERGRESVEAAAGGIGRIRQQMDHIGASMVKLSEQTLAIGEIIASVNDLAEQSNILAVNASIEAAKAGEQGKGFGVVAQEVRTLAGQSKDATTQVRSILADVQKATSAAMMATEQGSKAVDAGLEQSTQAGQAIGELSESISASARAASQIAASSQQQAAGMDQVAIAIRNIQEASSQNAAAVKQIESASRNLDDLGQKLKGLVQRFRV